MDRHDEQFEVFLRQFQLRKPNPLPEMTSLSRRSTVRWVLAAAAVFLTVAVLSTLVFRNGSSGIRARATIEAAGNPSLYGVGQAIEAGKVVRSNSAVGLMLALEDGSHIEMQSQSQLKLESAADGIRVRLDDGGILVTAAKQGTGHLYVQTRDAMVSVVGTVFFVSAEQSGTRVAVVEGEVHVQQGAESKKLLGGEQVASSPSMKLKPVAEEIAWSQSASQYLALLQQPATERGSQKSAPVLTAQDGGALEVNDLVSPSTKPPATGLPFKVQVSYFKQGTEEVRTLITIQLLNRDLVFQDEGEAKIAQAHVQGVIYRADNRRIPGFEQDIQVPFPTSKSFNDNFNLPNLYQETRYLLPGLYKLHLTIEDKHSQSIGVQDLPLSVPRIPGQTLQASSMILAYSVTDLPQRAVGTDPFALGNKKVRPNVSGVFRQDQDLNVWQEVYGLTTDQTTHRPSAGFELVISQNDKEIKRLVSTSTELIVPGQQMSYTNTVALANFGPGPYDVQIKVTDNLTKESYLTTGKFSVVASLATQSGPEKENPGQAIFIRACTACHSAEIAMNLRSIEPQLSITDQALFTEKRAEMAKLRTTLTDRNDKVRQLSAEITALETRVAVARTNYANYVSSHIKAFPGVVSDSEITAIVNYWTDIMLSKKPADPIPSDIPVQQQKK
jgi:hypothetical protein